MDELVLTLRSVLEARKHLLVEFNISTTDFEKHATKIPCMKVLVRLHAVAERVVCVAGADSGKAARRKGPGSEGGGHQNTTGDADPRAEGTGRNRHYHLDRATNRCLITLKLRKLYVHRSLDACEIIHSQHFALVSEKIAKNLQTSNSAVSQLLAKKTKQ